jgi:hypothetical protein
MKCLACGAELEQQDLPLCNEQCCFAWMDVQPDWVWVDGLGMWMDLLDDDDNLNHGSAAMHTTEGAAQIAVARLRAEGSGWIE